jgi:hypothetical protein
LFFIAIAIEHIAVREGYEADRISPTVNTFTLRCVGLVTLVGPC